MWYLVSPSTSSFLFLPDIYYSRTRISSADVKALVESLEDKDRNIPENFITSVELM